MQRLCRTAILICVVFASCHASLVAQALQDKGSLRQELIRELDRRLARLRKEMIALIDQKLACQRGKPFLGVRLRALSPSLRMLLNLDDPQGALVVKVLPGSPAQQAGLRRMDIILTIDGTAIAGPRGLEQLLAKTSPGQQLQFVILRRGQRHTLKVQLAARPAKTKPASALKHQINKEVAKFLKDHHLLPADSPAGLAQLLEKIFQKADPATRKRLARMVEQAQRYFDKLPPDSPLRHQLERLLKQQLQNWRQKLARRSRDRKSGAQVGKSPKKHRASPSSKQDADKDEDEIDELLDELLQEKNSPSKPNKPATKSERAYLGVSLMPVSAIIRNQLGLTQGEGVLVGGVKPGSAAEQGGIRKWDVILKIGARNVGSIDDVIDVLTKNKPGTTITIEVIRYGKHLKLQVTLQ